MADKKLTEVRLQFVDGASKTTVNQLVDDLLSKEVFNEEEADEVKENCKKQDQARVLIDNVKRKGSKASQIFLESLQCRDKLLAEKLGLGTDSSGDPVGQLQEPGPRTISATEAHLLESRNGIKLCPLPKFQEIQAKEAKEIYQIGDPKIRTRLALIICNIEFDFLSKREGAEKDLEKMTLLLEGLGYKVETETNLTSKAMADCLKRFAAREEHRTSDSIFLVLMSHGVRGGLYGVQSLRKDSDILPIDTVFSFFNNQNCPALLKKPKVVIIQACRGDKKGYFFMSDEGAAPGPSFRSLSLNNSESEKQWMHLESDFICLCSTTPDNKSYRSVDSGSFFIVELIKQIKEHAWNCDLEEIFRKVILAFEKNYLQLPTKERTTLMRKFYLFPGH